MRLLYKIFLLICLLLITACSDNKKIIVPPDHAITGSVSGHIYLQGSLKPIVDVVVNCGGRSDVTGKSGRYMIDDITPGTTQLITYHPSYNNFSTNVIILANDTAELDIYLSLY